MTIKKLTKIQKTYAKTLRATQQRAIKQSKQLEIALACFAYVASSDSLPSSKEVKCTVDCLSTFKNFANIKIQVSAFNFRTPTASFVAKLLSSARFPPFSQRTFQQQFLGALFEMSICDGPLTSEEVDAIEFIASSLQFPLDKLERIKARFVLKQKAKQILKPAPSAALKNYYKLLGCSPKDSVSDIKKSYRKLATKYHPDKHAAKNQNIREQLRHVRNFQQLQRAYEEILKDIAAT